MSDMVERVARAICEQRNGGLKNWESYSLYDIDLARVAIAAIREPTEAMMAAVDCAGEKRDWPSGKMHLASWQAMIDEALR